MGNIKIAVRALPELEPVLIAWASLFVLYLVFKKFLYKPVSKILNDRQAKISSNIEEASSLKEEAKSLKASYDSSIDKAKAESQEILTFARNRGDQLREGIVDDAHEEAKLIMERARKDIAKEKELAFQDAKKEMGELSILIASKIIQEEINREKQVELIDKFIDEVGNTQWQN